MLGQHKEVEEDALSSNELKKKKKIILLHNFIIISALALCHPGSQAATATPPHPTAHTLQFISFPSNTATL